MTLRMRLDSAQDAFNAKEGQLQHATESVSVAEEGMRQAVQRRDKILNEHRAAQARLEEARKEMAQAKEERRARKAKEKEAKRVAKAAAPETTAAEPGGGTGPTMTLQQMQEALQEQAAKTERLNAAMARLQTISALAQGADTPEALQQLREAALGLEHSIQATPTQEQEEMDTSEDQRTGVLEPPLGDVEPGLHESLAAQRSQELLDPVPPEPPQDPHRGKDVIEVDATDAAPATPSRGRKEEANDDGNGPRDRSRDRERKGKGKNRDKNKEGGASTAKG